MHEIVFFCGLPWHAPPSPVACAVGRRIAGKRGVITVYIGSAWGYILEVTTRS